MASIKLSYTKLSKSYGSSEQEEEDGQVNNKYEEEEEEEEEEEVVKRSGSRRWLRLRSGSAKRYYWRRPRVIKIARLRRVLRRKVKVVGNAVRVSVDKVITRLKQGKPFFGELFAGNYMFMQVSPSPAFPMPLTNKTIDNHKLKLKLNLNNGGMHLSLQSHHLL